VFELGLVFNQNQRSLVQLDYKVANA
jgi:hypothetical protein